LEFAVLPSAAWVVTRESEESNNSCDKNVLRKKTNKYERKKLFFTLFIDRLRNMTLPTPAQVEKFLIGAARGLLVRHRNRESDILVERKPKNWLKLTKSISYTCQPPFARGLRPIH
jgi:hypothetical protein